MALALALPGAAAAQAARGELESLRALVDAQARQVAEQARQIETLSARLRAIEERRAAPVALAAAPPAPPAASPARPAVAASAPVRVNWDAGVPEVESADGVFTFRPRLRVLGDVSTSGGSRFADRNLTGTELRLLRLGAQGTISDFAYKAEIDFAGDEVTIRDAWLGYEGEVAGRDLSVLLGNKLNDRSLDGATSITSIPFAERNTVANLIAPQGGAYGVGLYAAVVDDFAHVSANIKGEGEGSNDGTRNDDRIIVARGHIVPVHGEAGFLHLGGWVFQERINRGIELLLEGDVEGSNFNQNIAVLSGEIRDPRRIDAYGTEIAGVFGRGWLVGEYGRRAIRTAAAGRFVQDAWSVSGGLFLTGETPPLSTSEGVWHRPEVRSPVTEGGPGAFELLLRYDEEDQSDAPSGGRGSFATAGLNWYLNDWSGFKLNVVRYSIFNPIGDFPGRDRGIIAVLRGEIVF